MTTPPEIILFIGAGASHPLGLPTTSEFSQILASQLSDNNKTLWHQFDSQKDAEEVIQNINTLVSFPNINIVKQFLLKQISISDTEQILDKMVYVNRIQDVSNTLHSRVILPITKLEKIIDNCRMLNEEVFSLVFSTYELDQMKEQSAVDLYRPFLSKIMEHTENTVLPIFTTNYDRVLTVAVEGLGYELVDGFRNERRRRFFRPETYQSGKPKDVHLFHLHGAINWRRTKDGRIEWLTTGERVSKSSKIYSENVLIPLGSHQYPYVEPFKTCHDYLRTYLEKAKVCIIVGYTFRNEPINYIFEEALLLTMESYNLSFQKKP